MYLKIYYIITIFNVINYNILKTNVIIKTIKIIKIIKIIMTIIIIKIKCRITI